MDDVEAARRGSASSGRRCPRRIVGALPSIVWNLRHDFGSFHSTVPDTTTYAHRLRLFVSPLLPLLLGLREDYTQARIIPSAIATLAIEALLAGLFAWGAWRQRRGRSRCST